jgi:chromosome segregation ATPase
MILLMYFYHWAFVFVVLPGAAITTLIAVVAWKRRTTRQRVEPLQLERLQREQWLLGRLEHYRLQGKEVDERLQRYRKQVSELRDLDAQMAEANGDFEQRRQVVQRGLDALQHHVRNDEKLRAAIDDTIEMVEIEYRASRVLDHLPDEALDRLSTTIAELDAIEAENEALEAQLEANAEVNVIAPG